MQRSLDHQLVRVMIDHGHADYLRTYVLFDAPLVDVPLRGIAELMHRTSDDEDRRVLFRRALEAWRAKELVDASVGLPEHQVHALEIFRSFDILMELDPARSEQLTQAHSELAEALKRHPKGTQTMAEEAEARRQAMPGARSQSPGSFRYGRNKRRPRLHDRSTPGRTERRLLQQPSGAPARCTETSATKQPKQRVKTQRRICP